MKFTLALAALATAAYAQQCTTSTYSGTFSLQPVNATSTGKRSIEERQTNTCSNAGALVVSLNNGVLTDSKGRIGSIVANYQFQFDGPPPQAGALVTSGFSICSNNTLASNGMAVFYQCYDNTRTSIYGPQLTPVGGNCYPVYYTVIPCGSSSSGGQGISTSADGQPVVTPACVPITTMSDGQPVVSSCPPVSSCVPITTMSDGQPVVSSCPTTAPASTCVPITTMSDGQPVVSSCPTSAPTSTCVPITTMSDGQPVVSSCPTSTIPPVAPVTPTPTGTGSVRPTSVPSTYLAVNAGNAQTLAGSLVSLVAAVAAMLL